MIVNKKEGFSEGISKLLSNQCRDAIAMHLYTKNCFNKNMKRKVH